MTTAEVRYIKKRAREMIPNAISISHILPRAYCVAKTAEWCAVFAVPTQDREPQVRFDPWAVVQNKSAVGVKTGDWRSLAYIASKDGTGSMYVIDTQ